MLLHKKNVEVKFRFMCTLIETSDRERSKKQIVSYTRALR